MSLLVATPCYGGMATEPYMASRDILRKELIASSFPHDFLAIGNESLITRARNVIAASFRNETKFDCLLFIDADIEFEPADVALLWNLCYEGVDVAVGPYRFKNINASRTAWVNGKLRPVDEFKAPFEVDYAGTGFMMIRREVFDKLEELHPEWRYTEGFPLDERRQDEMECVAFFQDPLFDVVGKMVYQNARFHVSEDYFFVHHVRKAGMKVIMHPDIHLGHWGQHRF